jgi:hypothetical protein
VQFDGAARTLRRLAKEKQEWVVRSRRAMSGGDWFTLGKAFLSSDVRRAERYSGSTFGGARLVS